MLLNAVNLLFNLNQNKKKRDNTTCTNISMYPHSILPRLKQANHHYHHFSGVFAMMEQTNNNKSRCYFSDISIIFVFEFRPRIIVTLSFFTLKQYEIFFTISLLALPLTGAEQTEISISLFMPSKTNLSEESNFTLTA